MTRTPPSVLIVDDEAVMVMLLEMKLRAKGFNVCGSASSKEEAVSMALENSPDYIVMDIRLSETGDGIEAAREILEKITTNLIFVSGYSEGEIVRQAMDLHPRGYLVKPFDMSELFSLMDKN